MTSVHPAPSAWQEEPHRSNSNLNGSGVPSIKVEKMDSSSRPSSGNGASRRSGAKAKPKQSWLSKLLPNLRYLMHLKHNPCNSRVHERDKWLMACLAARGSDDKMTALYDRVNTMLDTQSLVTTFVAGFSFLVISDDIVFTEELIPRNAVVALLGFAFILSVTTTLVAVTVKTHITEIGYEQLYTFFSKYAGLMSLLAHLIIQSITAFMTSGLMIMFNKFGLITGSIMVSFVGILFAFLALLNLELRDRSMLVLGFQYAQGEYRLPKDIDVWCHSDEVAEAYKGEPATANEAMFLAKQNLKSSEVQVLADAAEIDMLV